VISFDACHEHDRLLLIEVHDHRFRLGFRERWCRLRFRCRFRCRFRWFRLRCRFCWCRFLDWSRH
jgi:hypothetical protein